jgi:general secretion pathway protein H
METQEHNGLFLAARRRGREAFTLIELLIVVALIALLGGVVVSGTGMLGSARVRTAAGVVMSGVRQGITRANATGKPARLTFDFENSKIILEATSGRMLRSADEDDGPAAGAEDEGAEEREALQYAKEIVEGPRAPKPSFSPVSEGGFNGDDGQGRELGAGVKFLMVHTEHDREPVTEGKAYIYFWPGGNFGMHH